MEIPKKLSQSQITILLILLINGVVFGLDFSFSKRALCINSTIVERIDIQDSKGQTDRIFSCEVVAAKGRKVESTFSQRWFYLKPLLEDRLGELALRFSEAQMKPPQNLAITIVDGPELQTNNATIDRLIDGIFSHWLTESTRLDQELFWRSYWKVLPSAAADHVSSTASEPLTQAAWVSSRLPDYFKSLSIWKKHSLLLKMKDKLALEDEHFLKWIQDEVQKAQRKAASRDVIYFKDSNTLVDVKSQKQIAVSWLLSQLTFKKIYIFSSAMKLSEISTLPVRAQWLGQIHFSEPQFQTLKNEYETKRRHKDKVVSLLGLIKVPYLRAFLKSIDSEVSWLPVASVEALAKRFSSHQRIDQVCQQRPHLCKALLLQDQVL